MDTGRNDPCACGSGKKYKRCCGAPKTDPLELAAGRVRAAQDIAEPKVRRFIDDEFGERALDSAWDEYDLTDGRLAPGDEEADLFASWFLYDWEPWARGAPIPHQRVVRLTPALVTLASHEDDFSDSEEAFLAGAGVTPTSFHEVLSCEPGRTMTLRDILLGTEMTIFEKSGSEDVKPGDILYARAVGFDEIGLIVGSGDFVLPPSDKIAILDVAARLRGKSRKLTREKLWIAERTLRGVYFELREQIVHPRSPVMCNADGDPMEFHTLTYRIDNAKAAFAALAPLAADIDREELVADAKHDRRGALRQVTFPWTRVGKAKRGVPPRTTVANITINGTTLTVGVNSANRAKAARAEITKRLGERATSLRDEVQSIDEAMAENARKRETAKGRAGRKRDEDLQAQPEIQAFLAKMNADHYATWPDVPLPALKGKTPRAAVRTADGRERVEALILDFQRTQEDGRSMAQHYDFSRLRSALGLPRRQQRGPRSIVPPLDDEP